MLGNAPSLAGSSYASSVVDPMDAYEVPGDSFANLANEAKAMPAQLGSPVRAEPPPPTPPPVDEAAYAGLFRTAPPAAPPLPETVPRDGFGSIAEEKQDILSKFKRLRDRGVHISQAYHINSNIVDMRMEYDMLKKAANTDASVKFQRKVLVAVTSALEWANRR